MADTSGAPRRVSMAYILGFSNKPFKDGDSPAPAHPPPPRHPNVFRQMVTTPGGVIEWAASDGRRGRLTGPGKPRLTATNLAQVPSAKASAKAASKKGEAEDDVGGLLGCGLLEDATTAPAKVKPPKDEDDDALDSNWTEEQDQKLLELRGGNGPWAETAKELGKKDYECKARFKKIKPEGWQNSKGSGGGKQTQNAKKTQKSQNQNEGEKEEDEKKAENANQGFTPDDGGNGNKWDTPGNNNSNKNWTTSGNTKGGDSWNDPGNNSGGNDNSSWETSGGNGTWMANNSGDYNDNGGGEPKDWDWGAGNDSGNKDASGDWNTGGGEAGGGGDPWPTDNNTGWDNGNNNTAIDDKNSKKTASRSGSSKNDAKSSSDKPASQSESKKGSSHKSEKQTTSAPAGYELRPDSTFSADDLRLIAKILQQDCQMVWNRVSWKFKDKTGRNLHPDVFEKKITGRVEEGSSDRGRR